MRDLAAILNRKRQKRGSIDFDLPEAVIEFDENGLMKGVTRSERNQAHRLIEEFMLSANEAVATYLENAASLLCIASTKSPIRSALPISRTSPQLLATRLAWAIFR